LADLKDQSASMPLPSFDPRRSRGNTTSSTTADVILDLLAKVKPAQHIGKAVADRSRPRPHL
jgi:hypothetical protein